MSTNEIPAKIEFEPAGRYSSFADLPRFGRSRDVVLYFSRDEEDNKEYMWGLYALSAFIYAFFFTWTVWLLYQRFYAEDPGWKSGKFLLQRPTEALKEAEEYKDEDHVHETIATAHPIRKMELVAEEAPAKLKKFRKIFVFFAINYILFAILFVTKGLTKFQNTTAAVHGGAMDVGTLAGETHAMIHDGLRALDDLVASVRPRIMVELEPTQFCPNDPSMVGSPIGRELVQKAVDARELITRLSEFDDVDLAQIESNLGHVAKGAQDAEYYTDGMDITDWRALMLMMPYIILPVLVLTALAFTLMEAQFYVYEFSVTCCFFPIMFAFTCYAWFFAGTAIVLAGFNGDFCAPEEGNADTVVMRILEERGFANTTALYDAVGYYVSQCTEGTDPLLALREYLPDIENGDDALRAVAEKLSDIGALEQLSLYCGRDYDSVHALVEQMTQVLTTLREALLRSLDLLSCQRLVPIYTGTVYEAGCQYSIKGLVWMLASSVIVAFSGMMMCTYGAAFKPIRYEDVEPEEEEE